MAEQWHFDQLEGDSHCICRHWGTNLYCFDAIKLNRLINDDHSMLSYYISGQQKMSLLNYKWKTTVLRYATHSMPLSCTVWCSTIDLIKPHHDTTNQTTKHKSSAEKEYSGPSRWWNKTGRVVWINLAIDGSLASLWSLLLSSGRVGLIHWHESPESCKNPPPLHIWRAFIFWMTWIDIKLVNYNFIGR